MSKRNRAAKAQPDKKVRHRFKQTVVEARTDDLAGLAQQPGGLIAAAAVGTIQAQAARLGDTRLQTVQRQALAAQIGWVQGNQHLQRVVTSLRHNERAVPYQPKDGKGYKQPRVASRPIQASTAPADVLQGAIPQHDAVTAPPKRELSLGERAQKWAFEKALSAAGVDKKLVMGLINQAGGAVMEIIEHPGRFVNTLIQALKQGFLQFKANIGKHLKAGLIGWLFGTLSKAGIQLPQDLSLKSILSLVLQVLGITVDRIKQKVAKHIGEKNVARIEKAWEILSTFMKEGIGGLWNMLKDYLVDLKETVIGEIKNWVITQIIQAAVLKIVSMFNPVSGLIAIVKTICNMIRFLIERASQIQALFQTVAGSVVPLAMGNFETVANKVEQTLARLLPVAIGFLASLLGIGGIANKIKKIIKKLQAKVDKAIDKMISKVANNIKRFFGRGKSRRSEPSDLIDEVKKVVATRTKQPFSSLTEAQQTVQQISTQYRPKGLKSLRLVEQKGKEGKAYNVVASASPDEDVGSVIISTSAVKPTPGNIRYAIDGQGRPRRAWGWLSKTEGKRSPTAQSRISQSLNRLMREFGLDIQFHAGHLIGRQFGGSGTEENLVPMEQVINLSWYKAFEGAVASQVEETQGNELLYADVRVVYPDDPFKNLMKPEAVSKLPKNTREKLASAFRRVPEAIAWTKLVRREVGGKEIELAVPPPFPARQKLPSLGRILGAGAVIGEKVRTGKELFS